MARLIGIDEAGYGPNLGPLVISAVTLDVPDAWRDANLWQALNPLIVRSPGTRKKDRPDDPRWVVDDSKAIYSTATGLKSLERNVLIGLRGLGPLPTTLAELWTRAGHQPLESVLAEPWFNDCNPPLPRSADVDGLAARAAEIHARLSEHDVRIVGLRIEVVGPERFNAGVDRHGSKGAVLFDAARELLRGVSYEGCDGPISITIDKHGGRNRYGALLQDCYLDRFVVVAEESRSRSRYRVPGPSGEIEIRFEARADRNHLAVALASMVSKYVREILMEQFNSYWLCHLPQLRPTAGYPGDSQRFWDEIRPVQLQLGIPDRVLWRCR